MAASPSETISTIDTTLLNREFQSLRGSRSLVESQWNEIERYFDPLGSGGKPQISMAEGSQDWDRSDQPWDSTGVEASEKLAASIHGWVTSPWSRWFKLKWRKEALAQDRDSAAWLDEAGDKLFRTLGDSDFTQEIAAWDSDLVRYANAFLIEEAADEQEWKGVDFETVQVRDGYFRLDSRGNVERFFRKLFWPPSMIMDLCARHGWTAPPDVVENAKKPDQNQSREEWVFCVFVRPEAVKRLEHAYERNRKRMVQARQAKEFQRRPPMEGEQPPEAPDAAESTYPLAPHLRPVGGVYFRVADGQQLGEETGYYEMPVFWAPWAKTAGSQWGHGPCNVMLATTRELNAMVEQEHMALAKLVDGPLMATERGVIGDVHTEPAGLTIVRDVDKSLRALPVPSHMEVANAKANDLRGMIRRAFHDDDLTLKDSPAMTATEVARRFEIMQRLLGATFARIEVCLSKVVKTTLGHLYRAGQLSAFPEKVAREYENKPPEFDVEYQGPLARSQRTDEVAAIERALGFDQALLKDGVPEFTAAVIASIDIPSAIRKHHLLLGVPSDLIKSEDEVQKAMEQFRQQKEAASRAAQAEAEGKAAKEHAQAAQALASAQAQVQPAGQPVPAQPPPPVTPAMGPVSPFAQPGPGI